MGKRGGKKVVVVNNDMKGIWIIIMLLMAFALGYLSRGLLSI